MGICDDIADWDEIGCTSEGLEAMREFGNDVLDAWGFEPVDNWTTDWPPPGGGEDFLAAYDPTTTTIHFDPGFLCEATGLDAATTAVHEIVHAAIDQAGWDLPTTDEELEAYGVSQHAAGELETECTSSESGSASVIPEYPWVCEP